MSVSGLSSKQKTVVAILVVVIVLALLGIGVLLAKLVGGDHGGGQSLQITVAASTQAVAPAATVTLVSPPVMEELVKLAPSPISDQPVLVAREEGIGPLAPVIIVSQPLNPGHRYRLEISALDGSKAAIYGSWGQLATSTDGQVALPQIEFFEGTTPFYVDVVSPIENAGMWSCSVSAGLRSPDLLGALPNLAISIWDVTGSK